MAPLSHRQLAAAALLLAMAALAMPASAARQPSDPAPRSVIAQSAQETQRDRRHEIDSLPGYSGELSSKHYSGTTPHVVIATGIMAESWRPSAVANIGLLPDIVVMH